MEDENCAQFFCPAGLLCSVPAPAAGWQAPLPARARSASPAATPAGCVGECAREERAPPGQRGRGEAPVAPPAPPRRGQTGQTASREPAGGSGGREKGGALPEPDAARAGPGRDLNSGLLCSPRGSAFLGFSSSNALGSRMSVHSVGGRGREERGCCGRKTPGVWRSGSVMGFPSRPLPRTSCLFPGLPEQPQPAAISSVFFVTGDSRSLGTGKAQGISPPRKCRPRPSLGPPTSSPGGAPPFQTTVLREGLPR